MTPLKAAVVGVGMIGSLHARIYAEHPLAQLAGVADTNPAIARAVAERLRVPWFEEVSELLQHCDFEAVSVAVPEHHRYQVALPLARAGKHLMLEKPVAPTLSETDRLIHGIESTGVLATVNFILRFDPRYSEAKEAVSSGRLGDVHTIFTRRRASSATAEAYSAWTDLLIGAGIHDLDVMAWLADSPVSRVYAETISRRSAAYGHDDAAMVLVRFENGIIGSLETSWVLPPSIPGHLDASLQVVGTEGGVFVDGSNHGLVMVDRDRMTLPDLAHWPVTRGRVSGDLAASLDHFIRSVLDNTPPEMTLTKARMAHAIVDAAKRSARLNQPVGITPPA